MKPLIEGQRGASLLAVIFFLVVVAFFGTVVVSLVATQSFTSVNEMQSTQALYVAEGGLERAISYLLGPTLADRVVLGGCAGFPLAGLPGVTASLNPGQFELNREANSPFYSTIATTIPAGPDVTSAATTIPVVSTANYAPFGRIMIDRELIDYTGTTANSFTGALRGWDGTLAMSHVAGTRVGQSQCTVTSTGGVTDLTTAARGRRVERAGIQLQEAWAVGNRNGNNLTLTRWNRPTEVQWNASLFNAGANRENLNDVSMVSYADGWTVGNERNNNFTILRWDGFAWALVLLPGACGGQDLQGISAVSSREVWAVGARYRPGCGGGVLRRYTVMRWDGATATWTLLAPAPGLPPTIPIDNNGNQDLNAVHVVDTDGDGRGNVGFAVGNNGQALQYDGVAWASRDPGGNTLTGVFVMPEGTQTWAVGNAATIWRWQGGGWNAVAAPGGVTDNLNGIYMLDTDGDGLADDGWAVGAAGRLIRIQRNGLLYATSSPAPVTGQRLNGVTMFSSTDGWAVGNNGVAIHWDGAAWAPPVGSGVGDHLNGVSPVGARTRPQAVWREVVS